MGGGQGRSGATLGGQGYAEASVSQPLARSRTGSAFTRSRVVPDRLSKNTSYCPTTRLRFYSLPVCTSPFVRRRERGALRFKTRFRKRKRAFRPEAASLPGKSRRYPFFCNRAVLGVPVVADVSSKFAICWLGIKELAKNRGLGRFGHRSLHNPEVGRNRLGDRSE